MIAWICQVVQVTSKANRSPTREDLGKAIRSVRKDKRLSPRKLAERSGLHQTYVAGLESGSRNPTWTVLGTVCEALDVSLIELVEQAEGHARG